MAAIQFLCYTNPRFVIMIFHPDTTKNIKIVSMGVHREGKIKWDCSIFLK